MKLGNTVFAPNVVTIVIPRDTGNVVFKATAVFDYEPFAKLCPEPAPPVGMKPGGIKVIQTNDPAYRAATLERNVQLNRWIVLESLKATEGLTWEKVDLENPETWKYYREELKDAFFTNAEINLIVDGCLEANSLDETKLEEARNAFLVGQAAE